MLWSWRTLLRGGKNVKMSNYYGRNSVQACCNGCQDRTIEPNCHTTCELYLEYRKELDKRNSNKAKLDQSDYLRYVRDNISAQIKWAHHLKGGR